MSSAPSQAITPAWANSASTPTDGDAAAAVCDAPARRPPAERPPTTASNGFRSAEPRELQCVAERLEVERGGGHPRVVTPGREQVVAGDVGLVAQRDERPDAEPHRAGHVAEHDADATGLGGDRQAAGRGDRAAEG